MIVAVSIEMIDITLLHKEVLKIHFLLVENEYTYFSSIQNIEKVQYT